MKLGPYAIEQDFSQYVQTSSDIIFAVVGTATKGPIEQPTVCTSPSDLIAKFGNLNTNCLGLYAAYYFLAHSSKVWFVRASHSYLDTVGEGESATQVRVFSAKEATVTIKGADASEVVLDDGIIFKAPSAGTYYNQYTVIIENHKDIDGNSTGEFDLIIKHPSTQTVEVHNGITLDDLNEDFESNYLVFSEKQEALTTIADGTYTLIGGEDGINEDMVADYILAGNTLKKDTIDMNLFAVPGVSDPELVQDMITLAENRKDCLYLVDPPNNLVPNSIADWHNGRGAYNHAKFNSSYAAVYYAWQKIYDPYNKEYVEVPPSVVVAPTIAESVNTTEIWYAPAGLKRGLIRGVVSPVFCPDTGDTEYLYSDENSINSIINDPQAGLCVFGQKTLHRENSALNRVNVRMLLNHLKRAIVAASRHMTFEPNDRVTWNNFEDLVEPYLKSIKTRRGIYDYLIVKGEAIVTPLDIDNYRMPCKILIKPTKAAEEIPIYFTLTSTGADFNEVLANEGISQVTI